MDRIYGDSNVGGMPVWGVRYQMCTVLPVVIVEQLVHCSGSLSVFQFLIEISELTVKGRTLQGYNWGREGLTHRSTDSWRLATARSSYYQDLVPMSQSPVLAMQVRLRWTRKVTHGQSQFTRHAMLPTVLKDIVPCFDNHTGDFKVL